MYWAFDLSPFLVAFTLTCTHIDGYSQGLQTLELVLCPWLKSPPPWQTWEAPLPHISQNMKVTSFAGEIRPLYTCGIVMVHNIWWTIASMDFSCKAMSIYEHDAFCIFQSCVLNPFWSKYFVLAGIVTPEQSCPNPFWSKYAATNPRPCVCWALVARIWSKWRPWATSRWTWRPWNASFSAWRTSRRVTGFSDPMKYLEIQTLKNPVLCG